MIATILAFPFMFETVVFDATISPKKQWAVTQSLPTGKDADDPDGYVNTLIDFKTQKPIIVLKGFHGMIHENHGGMMAVYSKDEHEAVVIHAGKWEPRDLALIATKAKLQRDILGLVTNDSKRYVARHHRGGKFSKLVFEVTGAKFAGNKVTLTTLGEVPKDENSPIVYLSLTYTFRNHLSTIALGHPVIKSIPERSILTWPESP
jgi:hypothetical protein